jgi:hypothetical protein
VAGDIRPGAFIASEHGKFPDAECGLSGSFFTCNSSSTFWG